MAKTDGTCATRLVPAEMRVDVGEAKTFYTRYLSRGFRGVQCKRGNKALTIVPDQTYGSAILHRCVSNGKEGMIGNVLND